MTSEFIFQWFHPIIVLFNFTKIPDVEKFNYNKRIKAKEFIITLRFDHYLTLLRRVF